jgi:putative membrane protein
MTRRHRAAVIAGTLLALAALTPQVIDLADQLLSLHMLMEMVLLALVIPVLAYGIGPWLQDRLGWLHPVAGIVALNLVLFGSQLPVVLDLGSRHVIIREAAQAVFMLGAFAFWWPVIRQGGLSPIARVGYLMVAGVPPVLPGITLALSHHLFYRAYPSLEDQQLAGLLLFGTAKLALVAGTFVILWRMLAPQADPPDDDDRAVDGGGPPPNAPAWLRLLDQDLPEEAGRPRRRLPARL